MNSQDMVYLLMGLYDIQKCLNNGINPPTSQVQLVIVHHLVEEQGQAQSLLG